MRRVNHIFLLSIIFLSLVTLQFKLEPANGQTGLQPTSLAINGEIIDNFANITYSLVFDNQASATDTLLEYQMKSPTRLYLSNVSASMGEDTYWGEVYPIQQAHQIFNDSVSANKSAVLVTYSNDIYTFEINVKAESLLYLDAFFEGYITRQLGLYKFDLFKPLYSQSLDFDLNLRIISSFSTVISSYVDGLGSVFRTPITNGVQLQVSQNDLILNEKLESRYSLNALHIGGKLITHSNSTDNFFAYLFAPEIQDIADREVREYIFIIDISGSMGGTRISQAKEAFIAMINTLGSTDLFNVIAFASSSRLLWVESDLATSTNKADSIAWVNNLAAGGSTNVNDAILDGLATFSTANTAKAMALLSDGVPTVGETYTPTILQNMNLANTGDVPIFSVAFGESTDEGLMASIAFETNGMFQKILDGDNAVAELELFYDNFAVPVALGVGFGYQNAQNVLPSPNSITGALFNGTEILSTGLFTNVLQITSTIQFSTGDQVYQNSADAASAGDNPHVELIWAHNSINKLLQQSVIHPSDQTIKDEIVDIAVFYGIVVPDYTALTIVLEEPTPEEPTNDGSTNQPITVTDAYTQTDTVANNDAANYPAVGRDEETQTQDSKSPFAFLIMVISLPVLVIIHRIRRIR